MKNRIRELMEMDGLNATEFSKKVKINTSVVSNILNDKNQPSFEVIRKIIAAYPEVDVAWLMTGHGDIFGEMADDAAKADENQTPDTQENSLFTDLEAENVALRTIPKSSAEYPKEKGRKRLVRPVQDISNQNVIPSENSQKSISKIIIVYQDNTFEEILPKRD